MFASTNSPNSFTSPNSATSATSATSAVSTKPAPAPTLVTHINAIIQKKALEHVGVRPEDIREALYAFIELLNLHTELPGAILISLYGGVFKDPASANGQKSTFRQCINSVLSTLSKPGLAGPIFFSKEKDSMTKIGDAQDALATGYTFPEVMYFKFSAAPHYSMHPGFKAVYTEFRRGWPEGGAKKLEIWGEGNSNASAYTTWVANPQPQAAATPGPGVGAAEERKCVVCLEEKANHIIMPCAHLCVCADCAMRVEDKCPVCRRPFSGRAVRVYTP